MRVAAIAGLLMLVGCATFNGPASSQVIGMRTGERVTVTLRAGDGLPYCTRPVSDDLECTFHEEFLAGLARAGNPGSLEPLMIACELGARSVPHSDEDIYTCSWHLQEIHYREGAAPRYRSGGN